VEIDLIDECFIRASPAAVGTAFHDEAAWRRWWPDLTLTVFQDRGPLGLRWSVTGGLTGSVEVWLEPYADGVVVHHYMRTSGPGAASARGSARARHRRAVAWKQHMWALKDELEAARPAQPSAPTPVPTVSAGPQGST
jgi:hypothetical protein